MNIRDHPAPIFAIISRLATFTASAKGHGASCHSLAPNAGIRLILETEPRECSLYQMSRDQPSAHELTYHSRHPSPESGRLSPCAPGKLAAMPYGMVPVSPAGTTGSFPMMLSTGTTH